MVLSLASSLTSSLATSKAASRNASKRKQGDLLPILIIPGLMSSGLEIEESKIKPEWEGERLWLNLASIGISAMYFGKAQFRKPYDIIDSDDESDSEEEEEEVAEEHRQANFKSAWLKHIVLSPDKESDPPGVKIRPIDGLEGVAYLAPGALTSQLTYVFGPVIDILKEAGYNSEGGNTNLMASTYDWRLAPRTLQKRSKYFTRTMESIEKLYYTNGSTPVVLLCHSLGCKIAHYLLNYALDKKGQGWIDKYIHTYMPVGGPHLGAPKAMRGLISGTKMSLDTFLSDEEALSLSRSIGSGAWMIPSELPDGVPAANYISPHGVLEITFAHALDVDNLVKRRTKGTRPKRYQLEICAKGFDCKKDDDSRRTVRTPFHRVSPDLGPNVVVFPNSVSFATETQPYFNEALQFLLHEPGIASAKKEKEGWTCNPLVWCLCCCCIPCMLLYRVIEMLLCGLIRFSTFTADKIAGSAGSSATLAFSERIKIPKSVWQGRTVTIKVPMYHKDDYGHFEGCCQATKQSRTVYLYVTLRWTKFDGTKSFRRLCSPVCRPMDSAVLLPITSSSSTKYEEFSGYDIAEREGLDDTLRFIKEAYDKDKYRPRNLSSHDPPPINRIHAIYGVNVPTEVGCVYSRQDTCLSEHVMQSFYVPDKTALIGKSNKGYCISEGLIMETPNTEQTVQGGVKRSGDGTVPYWSLAHVKTWHGKDCTVTVQELDNAKHREILNDERFHEALLDYVQL